MHAPHLTVSSLLLLFFVLTPPSTTATRTPISDAAFCAKQDIHQIALEGYYYGFPLNAMNYTRLLFFRTNRGIHANQMANAPNPPKPENVEIVKRELEALTSSAFLDLSKGPQLLSTKAPPRGQYFLITIFDAWDNVVYQIASSTAKVSIFGPRSKYPLSVAEKGSKILRVPTNTAWVYGQVMIKNDELGTARLVQKGITLRRLAGTPSTAQEPFLENGSPAIIDYMETLRGLTFWRKFTELACKNPPAPIDAPMMRKLACLGIRPCHYYTPPSKEITWAVDRAASIGLQRLQEYALGPTVNGWVLANSSSMGRYKTNYKLRAAVSLQAITAPLPRYTFMATACVDSQSNPLDGVPDSAYSITFSPLPPANAFWSLALYDRSGYIIDNDQKRFDVSSTSGVELNYSNNKTSVTIYLQRDPPAGALGANWIATPLADSFCMTLRLWAPKSVVFSKQNPWVPPPILKLAAPIK